jgi:hypothetical protein
MDPQFKRLPQQAGCSGGTVRKASRHVSCFGRPGQAHAAHFPS